MALIRTSKAGRPLYIVRWNYRRDEDGRQRYDEKSFRKHAEAREWNAAKSARNTADTERITVRELGAIWMQEHVEGLAQRTKKDYVCQYEKRILPYLGSIMVSRLTTKKLRDWRNKLTSQGTGPRTVNKTLDTLKAMVRWGRSEGLCANVMIDDVRRVKAPKPKPANPYPPETVQRIAEACEYLREATMIQVAAYAGLRWSELRALRWSDVDLEAETITLVRSLDLDSSFKSTKSDLHRVVPILSPGVRALKVWREERADDVDLVFCTRTGKPLKENNWYGQRLPKIREACGIHFDLHELRDTYASILIQTTGIGEAEITKWMGHANMQVTVERYAQLFDKRKTAVKKLADASLAHL